MDDNSTETYSSRDHKAASVLRLLDAPSLGPRRVLDLIHRYGSPEAVEDALEASDASEKIHDFLRITPIDAYIDSLIQTRALGGDYFLWDDPGYPSNLSRWNGRPPVLFFKGDMRGLQQRALALVGRVDPTDEGRDAAFRFARLCVQSNITVVSGLAKGIDAASHAGSLEEPPGPTYAVLGHGIDYAYPKENADLYQRIPHLGALISQFRTGVGPQRWTFPARNEVMCTLALGTVIIEGKTGCGSLIQADFSFKHGRPVFLLSRNLRSRDSSWAHQLVHRGAHVVERFEQVIEIVDRSMADFRTKQPAPESSPTLFDMGTGSIRNSGTGSYPVALFDLDGVLVDSRAATAAALADLASQQLGRPVATQEIKVQGKPHDALTALGIRDAYQVYRQGYDAAFSRHADRIRVVRPVADALRELRSRGIRTGAVTAQPARRLRVLLPEQLASLFDVVLSYNDTRGRKDVGITEALRRLNGDAQRCVYVGDQTTDLDAARKAGVTSIAVLWGFTDEPSLRRWAPDVLVARPEELLTALSAGFLAA